MQGIVLIVSTILLNNRKTAFLDALISYHNKLWCCDMFSVAVT